MEISYWQSRWRHNKTGWHMDKVFPPLKKYWQQLNLRAGATVLVPLCGKSLDLDWLATKGHYIIGVDVSEIALHEVIKRQSDSFRTFKKGSFIGYKSPAMELWCGDILKLKKAWLPPIEALYDKAALTALPPAIRVKYAVAIQSLLKPDSPILLDCFEYKQDEMTGPPFAVLKDELQHLFGDDYTFTLLHEQDLFNELTKFQSRGLQSYLHEITYHLEPK